MRRRLEASIESSAVTAVYKSYGVVGLKFTPKSKTGYPDRLFLLPHGRAVFMEFKRPGEDLRALQDHRCDELEKLGFDVIRGVDTVEEAVASIGRFFK